MGRSSLFDCFLPHPDLKAKVVLWSGAVRTLAGPHLAAELMLEFPEQLLCHADSFYIGQPIPALSLDDALAAGETYLLIPADVLTGRVLTAASLAVLSSAIPQGAKRLAGFCGSPFQHVEMDGGEAGIKISKEFLTAVMTAGREVQGHRGGAPPVLCNTPELRKHYDQLVGVKVQRPWSPGLETITERKSVLPQAIERLSPARIKRVCSRKIRF